MIVFAKELSQKIAYERNAIENQLIEKIEEMEERDHLTEGNIEILERSKDDLTQMNQEKARGAIFRSRAAWFNKGKKKNKYFFSLERSRSGAKNITVLLDESHNEVTQASKILDMLRNFYAELYTSDPSVKFIEDAAPEKVLNETESNSLDGYITMQELCIAAKNLSKNKSPGADGLPIEIYIVFWNRIKCFLLDALNYAYDKGRLHDSALDGIITLLPKAGRDTRMIKNLRPITLLNTDYKLLEKCLANRLKAVLDSLINEDQKGFMAGRKICTNIRRILDSIDYCERSNTLVVIMSVDAEKAFDRVEINSLLAAMSSFGMNDSFKKWTKLCFTDAKAAIVNNGFISERFNITRGVKQGGCCSAFYFLILIECLVNRLRANTELRGLDMNGIEKILGQYADDLDLYLWGTRDNIKNAVETIKRFQKSSGMKININKTTLLKLGSTKDIQFDIGIPEVSTLNVLGVDINSDNNQNQMQDANYCKLVEKSKAILNQWKGRGLSLFGKILVINTLVASLFVYRMSLLPTIAEKFIKQLNIMMNDFLWNGKKPKIPLKILQLSKNVGGTGLVNFKIKDDSLKFSWIKDLTTDSFMQASAQQSICRTLKDQIWSCNLDKKDINTLKIKNPFWKNVMEAWCNLNYVKFVPPDEIMYQCIWYNSHIRVRGMPLLDNNAYQNGLIFVHQLFNDQGRLKAADQLSNEFNVPILQINSILSALPKDWRVITTVADPDDCHCTRNWETSGNPQHITAER